MPARFIVRIIGIVLLLCGTAFSGTVVFDNTANLGNPFLAGVGFGAIPVPGVFQYIAEKFSVSGTFTLNSIELPITVVPPTPNQVDVFLMSDSGGVPGNVLDTFHLTGLPATNPTPLTAITSTLHPLLMSGAPYWVVVTGGTQTSFGYWNLVPESGTMTARDITNGIDGGWLLGGNPGNPTLALRVSGDAVPEPHTTLSVFAGLLVLANIGLRCRQVISRSKRHTGML